MSLYLGQFLSVSNLSKWRKMSSSGLLCYSWRTCCWSAGETSTTPTSRGGMRSRDASDIGTISSRDREGCSWSVSILPGSSIVVTYGIFCALLSRHIGDTLVYTVLDEVRVIIYKLNWQYHVIGMFCDMYYNLYLGKYTKQLRVKITILWAILLPPPKKKHFPVNFMFIASSRPYAVINVGEVPPPFIN